MLNKKERQIVGQIRYLAEDRRARLLLTDQNEWLEEKVKEIRRLIKKLPYEKCDGKKFF